MNHRYCEETEARRYSPLNQPQQEGASVRGTGSAMPGEERDAGEAAYRRIRADLVHGRLAPGRKLGLDGLRQIYGAGVSTLREALNRLASEGLVIAEGQRGFAVAPVSAEDLREVAELRLLLECHAIASPSPAATWTGRGGGRRAPQARRAGAPLLAGEAHGCRAVEAHDRANSTRR
jgi:hypothetical protein